MFNRIPSDVSEIVIVYSRSMELFSILSNIVKKFRDKCVETRVRDKLTEKHVTDESISFTLYDCPNREYNKPYGIYKRLNHRDTYVYFRNLKLSNSLLPVFITSEGHRFYSDRHISVKGCTGYVYRILDNRFYESGLRSISHKEVNILEL